MAKLFHGHGKRIRFEDYRYAEDGVGPARVAELVAGIVAMQDLVNALLDREISAEREDAQRDHEGPEIGLGSVAEGMLAIGRPLRAAHADEQEDLVAGVGRRVTGLGEH